MVKKVYFFPKKYCKLTKKELYYKLIYIGTFPIATKYGCLSVYGAGREKYDH